MALNTVRLYRIRKLVDSIFHDSNNAAYIAGISACLHAAFAGITHYANPYRNFNFLSRIFDMVESNTVLCVCFFDKLVLL